jgi:ABC-type multidrug transport system ATPase subunit
MNNAIEITGLCKEFKDFTLKDVTFSLPKGYIMGFVGRNGAGKTTTIRLILKMNKVVAAMSIGLIGVFSFMKLKLTSLNITN